MQPTPIGSVAILLLLGFTLFSGSLGQDRNRDSRLQTKLYEKDVTYENFACKIEDAQVVADFFKEHPPMPRVIPICHNDCPVVRCRPVVQFPSIARAAKVTGTVSVHVLVNEQGKTLYARVLEGHPLLWAAARRAACETQFNLYQGAHERQGVMHFYSDDSAFLGIPFTANQVP